MAKEKKPTYDELRHQLDTEMLKASSLGSRDQQQAFINQQFMSIHQHYQEKRVTHADYLKLMNRLAAYQGGTFNDYIDLLAGAAQMGALEVVMQGDIPQLSPEAARKRSKTITKMTGMGPVKPDDQ